MSDDPRTTFATRWKALDAMGAALPAPLDATMRPDAIGTARTMVSAAGRDAAWAHPSLPRIPITHSAPVGGDANAEVPTELAQLANRATARDPRERPASALVFRQALLEYERHRGSVALADTAARRQAELDRLIEAREARAIRDRAPQCHRRSRAARRDDSTARSATRGSRCTRAHTRERTQQGRSARRNGARSRRCSRSSWWPSSRCARSRPLANRGGEPVRRTYTARV